MKRIGPKMQWALQVIGDNPGCTKRLVAKRVGPHGSSAYGYAIVNRCLAAGLAEDRSPAGRWTYELHLTSAGRTAMQDFGWPFGR